MLCWRFEEKLRSLKSKEFRFEQDQINIFGVQFSVVLDEAHVEVRLAT